MRKPAVVLTLAVAAVAFPAAAVAKLPHPKNKTIVPGKSFAGLKLDMTRHQVFNRWGATGCDHGVCNWEGKGKPGRRERATASFIKGKLNLVVIVAASTSSGKFKPGKLSKWKTKKGKIHLGSPKSMVPRFYPKAQPNNGEAVNGYDLFTGTRPNLRFTRFSTPGFGASPNRLHAIEMEWDPCHHYPCG